jgi:MFS family permease
VERSRLSLGLAAVAVAFAAADTYVVVLALPDMMAGVGLSIDQLQRAAPIVSGFLLGYVAVLPLIGRIADVRGRFPVLVGSLVVFAFGSLVTATAYDLPSMVVGRLLQGAGGGGLVPATLALVADLYPPSRRGVPLGVVGAVQELGSVVGPLYGAVILTVSDWRAIFAVNVAVALGLGLLVSRVARRPREARARVDPVATGLLVLALAALLLTMVRPVSLTSRLTVGLAFVPLWGAARWWAPLGLAAVVLVVLLLVRLRTEIARWAAVARSADLPGAALLALVLSGIVLAFATADPQRSAFSAAGPWLLAAATVCAAVFVVQQRRVGAPLLPRGALRAAPAWGAIVVSLFVGAALVAALVDIPIFARVSVYPDSQLDAALVLVRLLVALPVGALLGGRLIGRLPAGIVTAFGMGCAAVGLMWMSRWGLDTLRDPVATVPLLLAGLGFGLAVAPVNAALLAATDAAVHGVSSALLVVARMVGMLVGISALTELGLRRYYAAQATLPTPTEVCHARTQCAAYTRLLKEAGLTQLHTVFVGAAVCAVVAGLVAVVAFRSARTREVAPGEALWGAA